MRESEGASMRIDETCLARVQVAREWRGCLDQLSKDKKLARNFRGTRLVIGGNSRVLIHRANGQN